MEIPKNWVGAGHGRIVPAAEIKFNGKRVEEKLGETLGTPGSDALRKCNSDFLRTRFGKRVNSSWRTSSEATKKPTIPWMWK